MRVIRSLLLIFATISAMAIPAAANSKNGSSLVGSLRNKSQTPGSGNRPTSFRANGGMNDSPRQKSQNENQRVANEVAIALREAKVTGFDIGVEVKERIAILTGEVSDLSQKEKATKAAANVSGVREIDNRLIVTPPKVRAIKSNSVVGQIQLVSASDEKPLNNQQIADRITTSLSNAGVSGTDLEVRFRDGVATISGAVANPEQRAKITQVVASIVGVESVENRVSVSRSVAGGLPAEPQFLRPVSISQDRSPQRQTPTQTTQRPPDVQRQRLEDVSASQIQFQDDGFHDQASNNDSEMRKATAEALVFLKYCDPKSEVEVRRNAILALRQFQQDHRLNEGNQLGPKTLAKLAEAVLNQRDAGPNELKLARTLTESARRVMQRATATPKYESTKLQEPTTRRSPPNNGSSPVATSHATVSRQPSRNHSRQPSRNQRQVSAVTR